LLGALQHRIDGCALPLTSPLRIHVLLFRFMLAFALGRLNVRLDSVAPPCKSETGKHECPRRRREEQLHASKLALFARGCFGSESYQFGCPRPLLGSFAMLN
jgi:hypothetical protein